MRYRALVIASCATLLSATQTVRAQQPRMTTVFRLLDGKRAAFEVRGVGQGSRGTLEIEYKGGRASIHLQVDSLMHPQRVGAAYTAYVFWGVTGDGRVARLAAGSPLNADE